MHELSIAEALAGQVRRHASSGRVVTVELRIGALRGIEPDALAMCWDAVTHGTPLQGSTLEVESLPWSISCGSCLRAWTSDVPFERCSCGRDDTIPVAGDELDLVAITVDDEEPGP
jgi:hydrogenase nickel incorporation protein HypA/HybF